MVMPGTSADATKVSSNYSKIASSFDTYPSSVTSENILFNKSTNKNNNNVERDNNNISSSKNFVNSTVKEVIKKVDSRRFSKTLQWTCSNDFPYIPSVQSLPHSKHDCTFDMNEADNPELHVLYHRNNCKCSGQSFFYESNMKMTNEQRELQKHLGNDF